MLAIPASYLKNSAKGSYIVSAKIVVCRNLFTFILLFILLTSAEGSPIFADIRSVVINHTMV